MKLKTITKRILSVIAIMALLQGCGIYSFTGTSISPDIKTFQVNFFGNEAPIVIPGIDQKFTIDLQDLILNQTNLNLVTANGDLVYEGEITQYYTAPMAATSQNTADQNRLTIGVNVRFYDTKNPDQDVEQKFSFFFDFPRSQTEAVVRDQAVQEIYDRITQDVFNATLARW